MYCQWQYTQLQILNMTQPPGSHHPHFGSHLRANKVHHTRSCVGIGYSQKESTPLHHGEVHTHTGALYQRFIEPITNLCSFVFPIEIEKQVQSY